MKRIDTELNGLFVIEPAVHEDERGFFLETYRKDIFLDFGIASDFVQDSHSHSVKNVIRGLKFQYDLPTEKLVRVANGSIFAVGVDLRQHSSTFGEWESVELSSDNKKLFYLPFGFAFGFCVLSNTADVLYKLSAVHNAEGSETILWNDQTIGISWPTENPIVSNGDLYAQTFDTWIKTGGPARMGYK